jgi:hypothetical protein
MFKYRNYIYANNKLVFMQTVFLRLVQPFETETRLNNI